MNAQLTGVAGVFYVASELSMRGLVALPSIRNVKGPDILVANQESTKFAFLQVKTSKWKVNFWPIGEGARQWKGRNCYYVFVRRVHDRFEVFMEKAEVVAREAEASEKLTKKRGCKKWALAWPLTGLYAMKGVEERTCRRWKTFTLGPKNEAPEVGGNYDRPKKGRRLDRKDAPIDGTRKDAS